MSAVPAQKPYTVTIELNERDAYALAELCKRIGWSDARTMSVSDAEANAMLHATDVVRAALSDVGVSVR